MAIVVGNVSTSSVTHTGCVRSKNEDALITMPKSGLWAVADGMGGHEAGDYASQCIIGHLYQAGLAFSGHRLVQQIPKVLHSANKEIFDYAERHACDGVVGSTVVVLVLEEDRYHCFWSGDSRCYLLRDQSFQSLTRDHTEAAVLLAQGLIEPSQVEQIPESNILTEAIGIDEDAYFDYVSDFIYESDRFLLCSDGLNKVFTDADLALVMTQNNIDKINQHFLGEALNAGAPDNLSCVIVSL